MTNSVSASWRTAARSRAAAALLAALAATAGATPARAQVPATPAGFELTRGVELSLARVQELWLQWVGATLQDNRSRADESLRSLSSAAREVGFLYLPDLALGAAAQARVSAAQGRFDRAAIQLAAAETLDPGRPETSFAGAAVARARGEWGPMIFSLGQGFARTWKAPEGRQASASLVLWALIVLQLAMGLFVLLLAAVHGWSVTHALHELIAGFLPGRLASVVVVALVIGPVALPAGPFVLLLVWSALLWTFVRRSERIVLVGGWLVAALAAPISTTLEADLALAQSPPMRAWSAFEQGRLYGGFFSDVQVLRVALATEPATLEFMGDLHRTIGQWDLARSYYRRVLVDQPENIPVMLNLGAFYFRKGDLALANAYFERASRTPIPSAAAWYNLSLGYSDAYLFDDSKSALGRAREIDGSAVDAWIATSNPDRVLTFNGSLSHRGAVRRALLAAWRGGDEGGAGTAHLAWPGAAAAGALLAALLFDRLRRRRGLRPSPHPLAPGADSGVGKWARALVPAITAVEEGAGAAAIGNLALLAALLELPAALRLAGDLPMSGWPGSMLLAAFTGVIATAYVALRVRRQFVGAED